MAGVANLVAPSREEQINRAERLAAVAERNLAVGQKGAAQHLATCPWRDAETGSTASSRQPSSRTPSTCPWGVDGSQAELPPKSKKQHPGRAQNDTCPWGASAIDADSRRLAEAAARRQRPSPSNAGRAGSGAPKMFTRREDTSAAAASADLAADVTLKGGDELAMQANPEEAYGAEYDDDGLDKEEERMIIQKCLQEGMDEDGIMQVLDEWQNAKLIELTQKKMQHGQALQAKPAASRQTAPEGLGVQGSSVAASRQARSDKQSQFGPSNEEIMGVLNDYSKENTTPPESPPNALTIAGKRAKDRDVFNATKPNAGTLDQEKSRAAYLASKAQMDAAKSKQRMSSGIF